MNQTMWVDIKGFEGLYKVSSEGTVKSLTRIVRIKSRNQHGDYTTNRKRRELILKPNYTFDGYLYVNLYDDTGAKHLKKIHRLVAEHFVKGDTALTVNHIDGCKTNNNASNLEWVTSIDNTRHAEKLGLRNSKGSSNNRARLKDKQVIDIRTRKLRGEHRLKVYSDYSEYISFPAFEAVWYNKTWKHLII